jgi:hypothetical protein
MNTSQWTCQNTSACSVLLKPHSAHMSSTHLVRGNELCSSLQLVLYACGAEPFGCFAGIGPSQFIQNLLRRRCGAVGGAKRRGLPAKRQRF